MKDEVVLGKRKKYGTKAHDIAGFFGRAECHAAYDGGQDRATAEREARREMLECEARWVLSKPKEWRQGYLRRIERRRGADAVARLKGEIMRQWRG